MRNNIAEFKRNESNCYKNSRKIKIETSSLTCPINEDKKIGAFELQAIVKLNSFPLSPWTISLETESVNVHWLQILD